MDRKQQPNRPRASERKGTEAKRWTEVTAKNPDDFDEEEGEPARLPAESMNIARGEDPAASVQRPKSGETED